VPDPRTVGGFTLTRLLGEGGMGRVYLGRGRSGIAAVKVVRSDLAGDPEFRARFGHEIEAASRVRSRYTAALLGADAEGDPPWLATEYVPAPSVREAVGLHGPMPVEQVRMLGIGLAEALTAIHAAGIVHRDLKPANVLLGADGPKVIDFGIARAADATVLTRTGAVVGSPGFIAPEQITHARSEPAGDVFALGGVLAYAATGRPPFGSGDLNALLYRTVHTDPDLSGIPSRCWAWSAPASTATRPGGRTRRRSARPSPQGPTTVRRRAGCPPPSSPRRAGRCSAARGGRCPSRSARWWRCWRWPGSSGR